MPDGKPLKETVSLLYTLYLVLKKYIWHFFPPTLATISICLLFSFCLQIDSERSCTDRHVATEALKSVRNPEAPEHM